MVRGCSDCPKIAKCSAWERLRPAGNALGINAAETQFHLDLSALSMIPIFINGRTANSAIFLAVWANVKQEQYSIEALLHKNKAFF